MYSGVHFSILETIRALIKTNDSVHEIKVLTGFGVPVTAPQSSGVELMEFEAIRTNRVLRILWELIWIPRRLKKMGKGVIFHGPAYVLPRKLSCPSVLTVHDVISIEYPQFCQWQTNLYFKWLLARSIQHAGALVTPSHKVKEDLIRLFHTDPAKITVVPNGVHKRFKPIREEDTLEKVRSKYQLFGKFILFVGVLEPKKNISALLQAYADLSPELQGSHRLVIVGKKGWKTSSIYKCVDQLNLQEKVVFPGFVDAEDLPAIYSLAEVFVFPSLYEGFGMPVLEAMACGTPVLLSNRGALPEISGGAGMMVDPDQRQEMSQALTQLLEQESIRESLIRKGLARAQHYSWESAAEQLCKVYQSIDPNSPPC